VPPLLIPGSHGLRQYAFYPVLLQLPAQLTHNQQKIGWIQNFVSAGTKRGRMATGFLNPNPAHKRSEWLNPEVRFPSEPPLK